MNALDLGVEATNPRWNEPTIQLPAGFGDYDWVLESDEAADDGTTFGDATTEALSWDDESAGTISVLRSTGIGNTGEVVRTITASVAVDGVTIARVWTVTIPAYSDANNSPEVTIGSTPAAVVEEF